MILGCFAANASPLSTPSMSMRIPVVVSTPAAPTTSAAACVGSVCCWLLSELEPAIIMAAACGCIITTMLIAPDDLMAGQAPAVPPRSRSGRRAALAAA